MATTEQEGRSVPARPPRENLYRAAYDDGVIELRDQGEGGMPTLTGHFAVFDTWTEINSAYEGRFLERVAPTALNKTISEGRDQMRVLFQHGRDPQIGDKVLGPIARLEADQTGAYYEVPLLDTSYNRDLIPGLQAGLYGASFRFQVMAEEFVQRPRKSDYNPNGLPERTITEARVREFGPVTFGAYPTATSGVRSTTDEVLMAMLVEDQERARDLVRRAGISLAGVELPAQLSTTASSPGGITINITGDTARFVTEPQPQPDAEIQPDGADTDRADEEPEPPAATTPDEPEPSEATTRSDWRDLLWLTRKP